MRNIRTSLAPRPDVVESTLHSAFGTLLGVFLATSREKMLKVAPVFEPLFEDLQRQPRLRAKIDQVVASGPSFPTPLSGDKVKITINHCARDINLWVLLHDRMPEIPPDFLFCAAGPNDEDDFQPPLAHIRSIEAWNIKSIDSLSKIINELKNLFNEHQKTKAKSIKDDRIRFELDTASSLEGIEFLVERVDMGKTDVYVSVPLSGISVEPLLDAAPQLKDKILTAAVPELTVKFTHDTHASGKSTPAVSLKVSQKPPSWMSESCLIDFIPLVKETLEEFMKTLTLRRSIIREFVKQTSSAVLEYDSADFRKVSFLGEYDSTPIIVFVSLPTAFPADPPLVTLQSMAHFSTRPLFRNLAKVPWSPRWTAEEMVRRTRGAVAEALSVFKKWCEEEAAT